MAIKNDDLKTFSSLVSSAEKLNIRFGRFPILSLLYMFDSYKILDKFEQKLLPVRRYEEVPEPYDAYAEFRKRAKKSLRVYASNDKIVEPAEMLAILDDRETLKRNYKKMYRTDEVVSAINQIYFLSHDMNTGVTTGEFNVRAPRFGILEKLAVIIMSIMLFVCATVGTVSIAVIISNAGFGTASHPFQIKNEQELVSALESGKSSIILKDDIVLTQPISPRSYSGTIDGNGKTIHAGEFIKDGMISSFSGTIKNLNLDFNLSGGEYDGNLGIIAQTSSGNIEGVSVSGTFDISAKAEIIGTAAETPAIYISAFVAQNSGTISGSKAKLKVKITNTGESDAYFSSFAGVNTGTVTGCTTLAPDGISADDFCISTDTVDVAGIVSENYGNVTDCTNNLSIKQITSQKWSPMVAGISASNYGTIKGCVNSSVAALSCQSTLDEYDLQNNAEYAMYVAGIVARNNIQVSSCKNLATITTSATNIVTYVGGVVAQNYSLDNQTSTIYYGSVETSLSKCSIVSTSSKKDIFIGGVVADNFVGVVSGCGFEGSVTATTEESLFVGGVACINSFRRLNVIVQGMLQYLNGNIQSCYSNLTLKDSAGGSAENTHVGNIFAYIDTNFYENRAGFESTRTLFDNYFVSTETAASVGEVRYYNESGDAVYGSLESDYDGSIQIDSLEELPSGRRINE